MSVTALLNAIEIGLKDTFTDFKKFEQLSAPFTVEHIVERQFSCPAIFFGVNNFQTARSEAQAQLDQFGPVTTAQMVAVIVTKNARSTKLANAAAVVAVQKLLTLLHRNNFGQTYATQSFAPSARPMATARERRDQKTARLSFWAVTWSHGVAMNSEQVIRDWENITDFEGFNTDHFETDADRTSESPRMQTEDNYDAE